MIKTNHTSAARLFAVLLTLIFLAGCGGLSLKDKERMSAEELARKGLEQYDNGKYFLAVETFNIIKERFPFSRFSLLAELKSADCRFNMGEYAEALELYKSFETNHPTNEAIPYVIFQIGRSHYRTINTIDRDTSGAHQAIKAFSRLLRSYPNSPYTAEAKALIRKANNFLAEHELYVANFYMRTKEFGQARGRVEYLLNGFPDTPAAARGRELAEELATAGYPVDQ
ncbi:MAG: outer membrane protein assembly factor BamD [Desulfurivibrionaceae bacterium]|nr:outer membrane protein assembly factor BamD [Desulfobulbales bacterium]MDT8335379.1 outer membrane protein assembly factor BamD [Desulfurivibrionaceae bacterium]